MEEFPIFVEVRESGEKNFYQLILTQGAEEIELLLERSQLRHIIQTIDEAI